MRRAPYQYGHWVLQPAYGRTIACIIDIRESLIWTRSLSPAQHQWHPDKVLTCMANFKFPEEIRWLHCIRVSPSNNLLQYSIIVLDYLHPTEIHAARRSLLETCLPQLGIRTRPEAGKVYLVPEFPEQEMGEDLWAALHMMNDEWKEDVFRGIVVKQATAKYQYQKDDWTTETLRWQYHKFLHPLST